MNLNKLQTRGKLHIPSAPMMFFLDLTECCNLNCRFCYNKSDRHRQHANIEDVKNILDMMNKVGCDEVIYLGGEPTIYPHLFEVLSYADSLNMRQGMITNAQVVNEAFAERLARIKGLEIGVSVHSCRSSVHNELTLSQNAFDGVERAVSSLEKAGIRWYSQTSLMKSNYLEIKDIHAYLIEHGNPSRMDLSRMVVGDKCETDFLDSEEYAKVFEQINCLDHQRLPIRIEAFPRCWLLKISKEHSLDYDKIKKSVRPCYAWVGQVSIDIHGNVRLCPTGGKVAGNILNEGIDIIWNSGVIKDFQRFQWQRQECLECEEFAFCVGACKMSCGGISPNPDIYMIEGGFNNACYDRR